MNLLLLSIPGIVLICMQLISIVFPTLELPFEPIALWVAITTIGLPCMLLAILKFIFSLFGWPNNIKAEWVQTAFFLIFLAFPSYMIFLAIWLEYRPGDGPLLIVLGLGNVFTIMYWGPVLFAWSWFVSKISTAA